MALRNVKQSRWLRGLNAAFDRFAQPQGSVARVSNMVLARRGAWKTCDGSLILSALDGMVPLSYDPLTSKMWRELFLYQPAGGTNGYFGLIEDPSTNVAIPAAPTLSLISGAFSGTFTVWITALDGAGGETPLGPSATVTPASQGVHASWTAVPGASGYNVYFSNGLAGFRLELPAGVPNTSAGPTTTLTAIDITGANDNFFHNAPLTNNTQQLLLISVPVSGFGFDLTTNLVKQLPASILPNLYTGVAGIGASGGSSGVPGTGGGTASGGVDGASGPLPQIVQFASKMFLALGNGVSPYVSDGTPAGTTAITNTFTASYPTRANSTVYGIGDQITVTVGGVAYVFQGIQTGTSAGSAPSFSANLGQTVADGSVIWKNIGQVSNSPAPRGAAHAEIYAGSLWVANTNPTVTSDLLDGPSAVRMSTANNPNSWNPLNAAQIARDNGQEITGLKAFAIAAAGIPTTQQLIVFKDFTTFVINGVFGAGDFSIQQAQTDQGCIAPRTIQFLPGYGLVRLTHLGFSIFDGLLDRLISEEIRPYIFGGQDDITPIDFSFAYFSKGAQTANPPMYVCACPIQNAGSSLITALSASDFTVTNTTSGTAVTLPSGDYFVKVSLRGPLYETAVTPQMGPATVVSGPGGGSTRALKVRGPALPAGYLGWRVYYGTTSGSLNQFVDVDADSMTGASFFFILSEGVPGIPPSSIPALLTRIFSYDLVLKAWTIIDLPFSISVLKQFRTGGSTPITMGAGFFDTTIRRLFAGDEDWDGIPISWSFQGNEVYGEDGSQRIYYRRLVIRGVGSNPDLNVTPNLDGGDQDIIAAAIQALEANQFDARVDIQQTCENFHATLSGTGQIEIDSLNSQVSPKAVGSTAKVFS